MRLLAACSAQLQGNCIEKERGPAPKVPGWMWIRISRPQDHQENSQHISELEISSKLVNYTSMDEVKAKSLK